MLDLSRIERFDSPLLYQRLETGEHALNVAADVPFTLCVTRYNFFNMI